MDGAKEILSFMGSGSAEECHSGGGCDLAGSCGLDGVCELV
jgi:hypothetical protein